MKYKISKELFEAVMEYENGTLFNIRNNTIQWSNGLTIGTTISINDFF